MTEYEMIEKILNQELVYATGCTEPAAISYCASIAGKEIKDLNDEIIKIEVRASKNILKNAMAAGLPKSNYVGVNYAAGIGALHGDPKNKLNVNNDIDDQTYEIVHKMVEDKKITVSLAEVPNVLYIDVIVYGNNHKTEVVIANEHTKVVLIKLDDEIKFKEEEGDAHNGKLSPDEIASFLNIKKIYDFCTSKEYDPINKPFDIIKKAEEVNTIISDEGLKNEYGLAVGKGIMEDILDGRRENNLINRAIMFATAGSDARMVGAPFAVVTNSGSGNQGITITMSVLSVARDLNVSNDVKYRALTIAHLCSIRIKSKFGTLSAFCGAAIASIGAACGITYLLGGDYEAMSRTICNMVGTVAGMICDGAKPDCSLKIYAGLASALESVQLSLANKRVDKTEGIVCEDVEDTINNICDMSICCSSALDDKILKYMLTKK